VYVILNMKRETQPEGWGEVFFNLFLFGSLSSHHG